MDDPVNGVDPLGLFTLGDIASTATTIGIEAAKQTGSISPVAARFLGFATAPMADWISPNELNKDHDQLLWQKEATENNYLDMFDTEDEQTQRKLYGDGDQWRKKD